MADYPTRVRITRNAIVALLDLVATQWRAMAAHRARGRCPCGRSSAGTPVPLDYKASDKVRTIDFRGYAYTRTPSDISGALMTHYDETKPQTWHLPDAR